MSYKNNESNKGKKWSNEEISDLTTEFINKISISEIASLHKRSKKAIELQALSLASKMLKEKSFDEVHQIYGFTNEDFEKYNEFKIKQVENKLKKIEENKLKKTEENNVKKQTEQKEKEKKQMFVEDDVVEIKLNEEQTKAFDIATKSQDNIFLTGSPGTGKSHTLKKIISHYKDENRIIGITSTTGCSAILIGARTLHSFLKMGINEKTPEQLAYGLKKYPDVLAKIRHLETLIIEEISMLSAEMFDTISRYLSIVRADKNPFGGIQLLLVGDFCQLPPVKGSFCFESVEWKRLSPTVVNLNTLVRQDDDKFFQEILQRARFSNITDEDIKILEQCKRKEDINYTCLCSTNKEADFINNNELDKLLSNSDIQPIFYVNSLYKKEKLKLCIGCKVMINWNIDLDSGIINGTTGTVVSLNNENVRLKITNRNRLYTVNHKSIKDEDTGLLIGKIMPLQLAWATTIHKSQGSTIDYLELDLGQSIFADGQAYVALSRVKKLENLSIINIHKNAFTTDKFVYNFYKKLNL